MGRLHFRHTQTLAVQTLLRENTGCASFQCAVVWQLLGEWPGQHLLGRARWAHSHAVVSMVLSLWETLLVQRFLNLGLMAVSLYNLQLSYRLHNYVYMKVYHFRANYRGAYIFYRYEDRWIDIDRH